MKRREFLALPIVAPLAKYLPKPEPKSYSIYVVGPGSIAPFDGQAFMRSMGYRAGLTVDTLIRQEFDSMPRIKKKRRRQAKFGCLK